MHCYLEFKIRLDVEHPHKPKDIGGKEKEAFFTYIAVNENVAESNQTQAINVIFFYKKV